MSLTYIIQANPEAPIYLCIQESGTGQFHRFEITPLNASRLAAECAGIVNKHLGGYNSKLVKGAA